MWGSQVNGSQGARWARPVGHTWQGRLDGQLGSLTVHCGQAKGGPSDTRSSDFSRETRHLGFCIKSDF